MIDIFVKAWDENNKKLLESFIFKRPLNYQDILERLITEVINPYLENCNSYPEENGLDVSKITVIDDGDYQGTTLYVIPFDKYQPSIEDYVVTHNYYGSCSHCDTFQRIEYFNNLYGEPEEEEIEQAAKEFHTLALHILQRFKRLKSED